jgi:hemerythrin-like domain-containing protein
MREHRLIEKIVSPLETELHYISHQKKVHPQFIYAVIDFFRTYADEYHHGKEEDILFLEMKKKELVPELQ